jgi:hypothetical protein
MSKRRGEITTVSLHNIYYINYVWVLICSKVLDVIDTCLTKF